MFWFVLFLIFAVLAIITIFMAKSSDKSAMARYEARDKTKDTRHIYGHIIPSPPKSSNFWGVSIATFIASLAFLITCLIGTILVYSKTFDVRKSEGLLPQKVEQKEELIDLVRDELSAEELASLVDATKMESLVIILGNPAGPAAQILQDRAGQIIALNREINQLKNTVDTKKIDVCNYVDNVFAPIIPLFNVDCNFDFSPSSN